MADDVRAAAERIRALLRKIEDDASVDFLGTGSDSRDADREEATWRELFVEADLLAESIIVAAPPPLAWRREPPDRPGWWWTRGYHATRDRPLEVVEELTGELWFFYGHGAHWLPVAEWAKRYPHVVYAGPLPAPAGPGEETPCASTPT